MTDYVAPGLGNIRVSRAFNTRRQEAEQVKDFQAKNFSVGGIYLVTGEGEATSSVGFPIRFVERPLFIFGAEIGQTTAPVRTGFPLVSAVVLNWQTSTVGTGAARRTYYLGATIGSVVTSLTAISINIHWQFTGRGLTNPSFSYEEQGTEI